MNHEYRKLAMSKTLSVDDEYILWEHGSKLAFQYSNSGFKQKQIINGQIKKLTTICLVLAGFCFGMDLYFNTYAKNRQLNLEAVSLGNKKYELAPNSLKQNNTMFDSQENVATMSLDEYVSHIQKPNFKCGELKTLNGVFSTKDGYPLCKQNSLGDIYIAGNVKVGETSQPILSIIHEGKIFNLNLDVELGISIAKINGADTLSLDRVMNSFASTFPENTREFKANALVRTREKQ